MRNIRLNWIRIYWSMVSSIISSMNNVIIISIATSCNWFSISTIMETKQSWSPGVNRCSAMRNVRTMQRMLPDKISNGDARIGDANFSMNFFEPTRNKSVDEIETSLYSPRIRKLLADNCRKPWLCRLYRKERRRWARRAIKILCLVDVRSALRNPIHKRTFASSLGENDLCSIEIVQHYHDEHQVSTYRQLWNRSKQPLQIFAQRSMGTPLRSCLLLLDHSRAKRKSCSRDSRFSQPFGPIENDYSFEQTTVRYCSVERHEDTLSQSILLETTDATTGHCHGSENCRRLRR